MPGSPATSPRYGIARYADGDTASFSSQINPIVDALDRMVSMKCVSTSASGTAATNTWVYVNSTTGAVTITLPSTAVAGDTIAVTNQSSNGVTVATAGGQEIFGGGAYAATSVPLGAGGVLVAGVSMWLAFNGANWIIISGQQASGWLNLTPPTGWQTIAGRNLPRCRLIGDRVELSGEFSATSGTDTGFNTSAGFIPAVCQPSVTTEPGVMVFNQAGSTLILQFQVLSGGIVHLGGVGTSLKLDGISYALS